MTVDFEKTRQRLGPLLSLISGGAAAFYLRKGADYAPITVGIVLLAWWLTAVLTPFLFRPAEPDPSSKEFGKKRYLVIGSRMLVAGLYQNALFFLVPLWFVSATLRSINVAFPCLLAGMALFSCFDHAYRFFILRHTLVRSMWSAIILFSALIPAATVLITAHLRLAISGAALLSGLLAVVFFIGRPSFKALRTLSLGATGALVAGVVFYFAVPLLPPTPIQCVESGIGSKVVNRQLFDQADHFPAGSDRVYAWFAVAAPDHYRQKVSFIWQCDGQRVGRSFDTEIVGGRPAGFRTWGYLSSPWTGEWSVDLITDAGQLIAREYFKVIQAKP
jgi:Protein of unknown function (DUF2914)